MNRKSFLAALGVFPLMKAIGSMNIPFLSAACRTQRDQEGPFYKKGAPERSTIESGEEPLTISGSVIQASDCKTTVPHAVIDIWHCDEEGYYDNRGFKCRGMVKTDAQGRYEFKTIYPPSYGRRPRHIHFKVRAQGFSELTSQIYFKGDPNINNDFARNAEAARVIELSRDGLARMGSFDIYI